jgi:mycothiol system anti-sigma-R factor
MDCSDTLAHLWEYLDDELPPGECDALRAHLTDCPTCGKAHCFDDAFLTRLARLAAVCNAPPVLLLRIQGAIQGAPLH